MLHYIEYMDTSLPAGNQAEMYPSWDCFFAVLCWQRMHLADPGPASHDGGSGYILPQLPYSLLLLSHLAFSVVEGDSFSL